ncbi:hypothetical protein HPB48_009794 [Haemaphysalis longicornis]|uniref:Uncharacterized protein n=1 Tax=Haemaphysalis longicornis TaxID=44386 RepID=A0A9J6GTG9_HAELO|nr:hypothetical protein HPB48_009794 [Haemaphysalis longicornis]
MYPVRARCTALSTCFAIGILGENMGHLVFARTIPKREDIALAVTAVVTALAAVAASHLPYAPLHRYGRTSASLLALSLPTTPSLPTPFTHTPSDPALHASRSQETPRLVSKSPKRASPGRCRTGP